MNSPNTGNRPESNRTHRRDREGSHGAPRGPQESPKRAPRDLREPLTTTPQLAWASLLDGLVGIREASRIHPSLAIPSRRRQRRFKMHTHGSRYSGFKIQRVQDTAGSRYNGFKIHAAGSRYSVFKIHTQGSERASLPSSFAKHNSPTQCLHQRGAQPRSRGVHWDQVPFVTGP